MSSEPSTTMRQYLAELYRLTDRHEDEIYVSTSDLADVLHVTPPAINRMVSRLRELGYIDHERYQGVRLSPEGNTVALQQLRRHRIAEVFLVNVMGFGWDEVYDEASRMSTSLSPEVAQRMWTMAGEPDTCPHGEPIPDPEGNIVPLEDMNLTQTEAGQQVQISRVRTREVDRLQYLQALGLLPGTEVEVYHVAPFDGPMQLRVNQEYRIIGNNLANLIRVKLLN